MRDGIVTGEGVVLDLRPASFASRMLGIALDLVVLVLVTLAALWLGWELTLLTERPVVMRKRAAGKSKKGNNLLYGVRYAGVIVKTWRRERAVVKKGGSRTTAGAG